MNKSLLFICGGASLFMISCIKKQPEPKPNIILIMADDLGYSDIGCFGGEINTPNLDKLAEQGLRYTQMYNTARCCPTRASLITGLYPHEAGIGHMTHWNAGPGYLGYLDNSSVTIAEVLSEAGYHTSMTGKWHSGAVEKSWPENRGFKRFFGIHHWVDSYFGVLDDCEVFEDGEMVIPATDSPELYAEEGKEWYTTDVFTTKALEYIDEALDQGQPFFQYIAYNTPHWPLEAHDDVIEKYIDSYGMGYEALRRDKFDRMRKMGIISEKYNLPEQVTPDWESLSDSAKLDLEFRRAIYAAQIEIMDENIGRVITHLKEKGVLDNTVIFFLSDNGCSSEPLDNNFGYQWGINTRWNYEEWRNNSGRSSSQGEVWSAASNAPFRKHKIFVHEGGIATPFIAFWPDGISNPGSINPRMTHIVDIMATCVDLAGTTYPAERNGIRISPKRGISLFNEFIGEPSDNHEFIFWEHQGNAALRNENWKIVTSNAKDITAWELYNMMEDRTETLDLSDKYPDLKESMIKMWYDFAVETNVLPWPDQRPFGRRNPVDK